MNLDDSLMQALAQGQGSARERAFQELVARHGAGLTAFAHRLINDPHRAEDVVQETLLRVYQSRERYAPDGGATFRTWLYRIARNLALNTRRAERLRQSGRLRELPLDRPGPLSKLITQGDHAEVQQAIASLDARDREVLALRYHQGLSYAEIAGVVGAPSTAAVKQRAWRCLTKLRAQLAPEESS